MSRIEASRTIAQEIRSNGKDFVLFGLADIPAEQQVILNFSMLTCWVHVVVRLPEFHWRIRSLRTATLSQPCYFISTQLMLDLCSCQIVLSGSTIYLCAFHMTLLNYYTKIGYLNLRTFIAQKLLFMYHRALIKHFTSYDLWSHRNSISCTTTRWSGSILHPYLWSYHSGVDCIFG